MNWTQIWYVTADNLQEADRFLRAQRDADICCERLVISDAISMAKTLEEFERQAAKARQLAGVKLPDPSGKFTGGNAQDIVAKAIGMSRPTYVKAKRIVEAAHQNPNDPELQKILRKLDRSNKIKSAYEDLIRYEYRRATAGIRAALGEEVRTNHELTDQDIINFIEPLLPYLKHLSMRVYLNAADSKNAVSMGLDWQQDILQELNIDPVTVAIAQLLQDISLSQNQRAQKFPELTGHDRATYYRRLKAMREPEKAATLRLVAKSHHNSEDTEDFPPLHPQATATNPPTQP